MYNDAAAPAGVLAIAESAPDDSAAHGATSPLAKAMQLRALKPNRVLHQADWIASRFSGRFVSDANNALKTGYDPIAGRWPDWIGELGFNLGLLPEVLAPGERVGRVTREAAEAFGLDPATLVVAGTTDGCASFLATGASAGGRRRHRARHDPDLEASVRAASVLPKIRNLQPQAARHVARRRRLQHGRRRVACAFHPEGHRGAHALSFVRTRRLASTITRSSNPASVSRSPTPISAASGAAAERILAVLARLDGGRGGGRGPRLHCGSPNSARRKSDRCAR